MRQEDIKMKTLFFLVLAKFSFETVVAVQLITPNTNQELVQALCSKFNTAGSCIDFDPKLIIIKKIFDFTGSKGQTTEEGCHHVYSTECLIKGQKKLNLKNQCDGLVKTTVTYDTIGRFPLHVGSNKYIVSLGGGLKGVGLKIVNNNDVFIYGLSITDINEDVIWGGDAIQINKAINVWIHKNYFARVGRQMIATGSGPCQNILVSFNEFDGRTGHSAYCDGYHYWLWIFAGSDDTITLYKNYVHHTSGRGAHVTGLPNSKVLLHMTSNMFEDVNNSGLLEVGDKNGRVLMEGNIFKDVSLVVNKNLGYVYYPFNVQDASTCKSYLGRNCILNQVTDSGGLTISNDVTVLKYFQNYGTFDTAMITAFEQNFSANKNSYQDVDKYVNNIINTFKTSKPNTN